MIRYLRQLENMTGVNHSCICTLGEITESTFPAVLRYSLERACTLIDHLLSGALPADALNQELCIELEQSLIIATPVRKGCFILMQIEADQSLTLLRPAIRALKIKLSTASVAVIEPEPPLLTLSVDHPELLHKSELTLLLVRLRKAFADFQGRAAHILFSQIAEKWQQQYPPTRDSVFVLLEMLGNLIDDPEECHRFMRQIELIQQQTLERL